MIKLKSALIPFLLLLLFSYSTVYSQKNKIDSLTSTSVDSTTLNLYLQIAKAYMGKNPDSIINYANKARTLELEKITLENKLQEQQLNEANFQLITILIISLITVGFVITFYFLSAKKSIAERLAQDLQVAALKERLFELQLKHEGAQKTINLTEIFETLPTPLTEQEHQSLELSLRGFSNSEIAEKLAVSINTAKSHLRNIYKKLGISNKKEVIEYVAKS